MRSRPARDRRFLVPEVVQTSAMDCGPASLKCLLEGFGIPVSYGRLREACQTDVDGTSIDTIGDVAAQLGLEAEQIMLPVDHLLLPEARALPAILVVRLSSGATHFLVVWGRVGPWVQLMDPETGRRWISRRRLMAETYLHEHLVEAEAWRSWAGSEEFTGALRRRLENVGLAPGGAASLIGNALADPGWRPVAALDAATRMMDAIVGAGGIRRGSEAAATLERFYASAREASAAGRWLVPTGFWSVRPPPPSPQGEGAAAPGDGGERLLMRGAVLVRVSGRRAADVARGEPGKPAENGGEGAAEVAAPAEPEDGGRARLSPELIAALEEPPVRPGRELLRLLRADGVLAPSSVVAALLLAAGGVAIEALLFRGFLDIGRELGLASQRLQAIAALLLFLVALLLLELPVTTGLFGLGRRLEARLRLAFLRKIPRLGDRYLHSRLISDMAERGHSLHRIRSLPELGGQLVRSTFQLALTTAGIVWLDPASAPLVVTIAAVAVAVPLAAQPLLAERDLRVRNHAGALSRFYLDALLGLIPVRAHGAERAVRREHEKLLVEWARAGVVLQRAAVGVEAAQLVMGLGLAWLLVSHLTQRGEPGSVLLVVYWALSLPMLGENVAVLARQYPDLRNVVLRLLEPLGAPDENQTFGDAGSAATGAATPGKHAPPPGSPGVSLAFEEVSVRASGHSILTQVSLTIAPGSHVAIVGPSGAGKSSLVGLLLGWHRPASGRILVDGEALDGPRLERLRRETAWIDPSVQLWNRSLLENLRYGTGNESAVPVGRLIEAADLHGLLTALPDGLQTSLGEGGALVSGGEGQRVRLARAMLRREVRLAILDEPLRGLDREQRRSLLARARALWSKATLLCVTHDLGETEGFDRVIVVERGRIVEDGTPEALARTGSRYRELLEAERAVRSGLWNAGSWRRLTICRGRLATGDGDTA